MKHTANATDSTGPTPLCGPETTTQSPSPGQSRGRRALLVLAALMLCPLVVGVANAADDAVHSTPSRTTDEPGVQRFVFESVPDPLLATEKAALAKLTAHRRPGEALVLGGLPERAFRKLQFAYSLAQRRVREVESCGALFSDLGADGIEMLSTTIYRPALSKRDLRLCRSTGAVAYTAKGQPHTRVCEGFENLPKLEATTILIHEALHHAGLGEWPVDPDGMTPRQINRIVRRACGL